MKDASLPVMKRDRYTRRSEMKKITVQLAVVLALALLAGCGAAAKTIAARSASERADVFTEVTGAETIPAGYADVSISAEIKTHLEGYYRGESKETAHGKESYPFLFNIDGQAVIWKAGGKKHELPKYDPDGKTSRDPEAGAGMKYVLNKKIRVRAGAHKLFFGLPEDDYYLEADLVLTEGTASNLELKPKYWHKHIPTRIPTFLKGISKYEIYLNGVKLK